MATVFVRVCSGNPETTAAVCSWQEVDSSTMSVSTGMTPEQLHEIVNGLIYIVVLIIVFALIKKAIEI